MFKKISWAVFVALEGSYTPISYGDSEFECIMWLREHKGQNPIFEDAYVGVVIDNVVIQE